MFDFCGVVSELDTEESKIDEWDETKHKGFQTSFSTYLALAKKMFTPNGIAKLDFKWQRALLVQGDYFFGRTAYRRAMLVDSPGDAYSWKRLLRGYLIREEDGRMHLKSLWDKLDESKAIERQLDRIIADSNPRPMWLKALVKTPTAMAVSYTHLTLPTNREV